ncbi:bromodomain-containing protein [Rhizophagus clarus]|uniref:Bromodomain-containing protein n=1 Tax=Rhizophagus clarus TaxID=94130 RepID=A0A8H3LUA1_9GLOM|nr:bromodomain-containing protein [Rhizophagus clarus]
MSATTENCIELTKSTENYIGHEDFISYLTNESRNLSYRSFLNFNRDTIIASLTSLTSFSSTLAKWQNFNITWYNRFLSAAKELLEPNAFIELKKKVNIKCLQRKKNLQTFWQEIIKEHEKENIVTTISEKKVQIKDISKSDLSKENIKLINYCYDILYELEDKPYAYLFYKNDIKDKVIKYPMDLFTINSKLENNQYTKLEEFEDDVRLIFCNCYTYNNVESEIYCLGRELEAIFNKKWNEKLILHDRQTRELKRARNNDNDTDSPFKKQIRILEQNEDKLVYEYIINNTFLVTSAYENLIAVMDGNKQKGFGRFGYSDIFVLKETGDNGISLELKYISLVGLIKNQKNKVNTKDLEKLDKTLEKEDEEVLLKSILTGKPADYFSSGVFDERVKITKSNPNELKGFVIIVVSFQRILWRPVEEVISNYVYNKV